MTKVVVSPQAEADLESLSVKIADAAGEQIALNYVQRLITTIDRLSAVPMASGRPIPKLGDGLRCHPFGNYNIYLRYDQPSDILFVVRVLHGRRKIAARNFKP